MSLLKRFAYYFGGVAIGSIILLFILDKKNASCDYGPNARVLKDISTKNRIITEEVYRFMESEAIDTLFINQTLDFGDVRFRESQTQLDSCKVYIIRGIKDFKHLKMHVENCDTQAKIFKIEKV